MLYWLFNNNLILVVTEAEIKEKLIKFNNKQLKKVISGIIIYKKTYLIIIYNINRKTMNIIN